LNELLEMAAQEYRSLTAEMKKLSGKNKQVYAFYMGMLERYLQSCLIDADRTNTADFMSDSNTENCCDTDLLWKKMEENMQEKCSRFAKREDKISRQRCSISDRCAEFAKHPVGVCRLIVPTGGGKTLSSLRFAISYCRHFKKKKIIYTAPFMSILEQNSDEIRSITGDRYFTEHHSNLLAEIDNNEELQAYELRTEKWDNPVIATTMVQLLNTLFSAKSSSVRRMHRLSDAVIIIDEVQSIPLKCVYLFNLAVNFLSQICGTTVVLCSATQPGMDDVDYPMLLDQEVSMTGDTAEDFSVFRRTELISKVTPYGMTFDEAADFAANVFYEEGNLLLIVNTKAAAKTLYLKMREKCPEVIVIHLSTNLCPQHRREKIAEMRELLNKKVPLICVTTQLIEAGVDISFRCVVRSLAGLDNAAQAAGRCNRNGESDKPCPVYLIKLNEENIGRLEGVRTAQHISQQILESDQYSDYIAEKTQRDYFGVLYHKNKNILAYPIRYRGIKSDLLSLLSLNQDYFKMSGLPRSRQFFVQAMKTAGSLFEVIDNKTIDVIVPFNDEACKLIEELNGDLSPVQSRELLRKAQKYAVSIYEGQNRKLQEYGAVRLLRTGAVAVEKSYYDPDYGITTEGSEQEVLII
ncbi:MAG TPA: CRISPR-associated helicase Cas3', partial [Ruminococcus sp.]|nr:CRISPR-associated helicase Cas3' [Ruminococcus sp.]